MPAPPISERWVSVAFPGTEAVRVRVVEAPQPAHPAPVVLYLHGGGWVNGDALSHDGVVRELALRTRAAVVFPEYSRSPEARYPVALEQSYATAAWVVEHGAELGLDPTRMAVVGDSEGANLAMALTLTTLHRNLFHFRHLIAFTPVTAADFATDSYSAFACGYGLRREQMQWYWDQYAPDRRDRERATVCPLLADDADLAQFPPSLIITAEADVVRDEGEAFAARLRSAGAVSTAVRYEGMIHDFVVVPSLAQSSAVKSALAQASSALVSTLAGPVG